MLLCLKIPFFVKMPFLPQRLSVARRFFAITLLETFWSRVLFSFYENIIFPKLVFIGTKFYCWLTKKAGLKIELGDHMAGNQGRI